MVPERARLLCHYAQVPADHLAPRSASAERITLAVSTRDRAATLQRLALPSLVAATRAGFPVILVDQSRDDGTARLSAQLPGLTYLRSGPGVSRGRNVATAATTTEFIAFTDDDVSFPPIWPERIIDTFDAHPDAGAVCGRAVDESGRPWPGGPAGTFRWPVHPFGLGSGFNLAFRLTALRAAGEFDPDLGAGARYRAGEDTDILYRVARSGWSIICSDDVEVMHSDWRSSTAMLRLHHAYGIGAGAQTAGHVRRGDGVAARIAAREVARHARSFLRYAVVGQAHLALLQVMFVAGLVRGFLVRLVRGPSAVR